MKLSKVLWVGLLAILLVWSVSWGKEESGTDIYIGGQFSQAGGGAANHSATWDGSSWPILGSGLFSYVNAIAVSGTDIYVGGSFIQAGGVSANRIAKWNGSNWSALGSGVNSWVSAIAVSGTDVYVVGNFTTAGGAPASRIAKWNGSSWSALGSGVNDFVLAIAVSGTDVYAGGWFTQAGGAAASYIAKWNGSSWTALGSGVNGIVNAIAVSGTDVYVGGGFSQAGGAPANRIARWNGSSWSALGSGTNGSTYAIAVSGMDVYVGGGFTQAGGAPASRIAKWNGSSWSALGSGVNNWVYVIAVSGTDVYVGGGFTQAGGVPANYVAKWNGSSWSALGGGVNDIVVAIAVSGTDVYAGGAFIQAGGVPANYVAKWDGSSWLALGIGISSKKKVDFNQDGNEDILWRYYGPGGNNYVWYMGQSGSGITGLQAMNSGVINMFQAPLLEKVYWDAREAGGFLNRTMDKIYWDAREVGEGLARKEASTIPEGGFGKLEQAKGIRILKSPVESMVSLLGLTFLGGAALPSVADLKWQIAGTGDFNGDGKVDILWRYYGAGGYNYVWYMDGVTCTGGASLASVADTNWAIAGTGDFNGDGKVDILWRYYGAGGYNYVWYMDGVTCTGGASLPSVEGLNWQIAGTGDFNGDGEVDVLWRYYGAGGFNYAWYFNGVTYIGEAALPSVADLNWQIAGTGDFNGDGKVDILWRYYGSGGYNYVWYMNGVTYLGEESLTSMIDPNWKIVNR